MNIKEINLDEIDISKFNTRKDLGAGTEEASLNDLANSIQEKGLLNPIMVRKGKNGKYDLIAGQRRFLASKKIGLKTIPSIIKDELSDIDATIISLIENVQRADMNPLDKAKAYKIIYEKYQDYKKVAKETGVSVSTIKKYLTLLNLSLTLQEKLTTSEGPAGVGTLSKLAETFSPKEQEVAYQEISGFKQSIQLEILKRSEGDLNQLSGLRNEAMEGAFDTRTCTEGLCFLMPENLKEEIKKTLESQEIDSLKELVKKLK